MEFIGYNDKNIYLDNGASTLALKPVFNKGFSFLQNYGSIHRGAGYNSEVSTQAYETARKTIGEYIDADTETDVVIFTYNTTGGINMLSDILNPNDGNVLLSDIEHSSNAIPWRTKFKTYTFNTESGRVVPELIEQALNKHPNTQLVSCTWASNISGYITDMEAVYKICKKHNVLLLADASQYAPHFKPSLKCCDFIVYCGHKMYAPFGIGVLAGRKDILNTPNKSDTGGGNVIYASPFTTIYKPSPWMHEAGTPNGFGAVAMAEAHHILYDTVDLQSHNKELNQSIEDNCEKLKNKYDVFFYKGGNKTPIFLISAKNPIKNKEIVSFLNSPIDKYEKSVFCREGSFCAYQMIEKLRDIKTLNINCKRIDGKNYISTDILPPEYSFIRFSAGLINKKDDIAYAVQKLLIFPI